VALLAGEHLLQVLGEPVLTLSVELKPATTPVLAIPEAIPLDAPTWAASEQMRESLSLLLSITQKLGQHIYLTALEGVWSTEVGSPEWQELVAPAMQNAVTFGQVPAGSLVTYAPADGGTAGHLRVPWEEGELNDSLGILIAPEIKAQGLREGPYTYRVDHPLLGQLEGVFVLHEGGAGQRDRGLGGRPGLAALEGAYASYLSQLQQAERAERSRRLGRVGAVITGGLAAGAVDLGVKALITDANKDALDAQYQAATETGDTQAANGYWVEREQARSATRRAWFGAGALGGGAVVGLGFNLGKAKRGRAFQGAAPSWDPQHLELEIPAPAEEPAAEEAIEPSEEASAE